MTIYCNVWTPWIILISNAVFAPLLWRSFQTYWALYVTDLLKHSVRDSKDQIHSWSFFFCQFNRSLRCNFVTLQILRSMLEKWLPTFTRLNHPMRDLQHTSHFSFLFISCKDPFNVNVSTLMFCMTYNTRNTWSNFEGWEPKKVGSHCTSRTMRFFLRTYLWI